jgi:hypothetical protein
MQICQAPEAVRLCVGEHWTAKEPPSVLEVAGWCVAVLGCWRVNLSISVLQLPATVGCATLLLRWAHEQREWGVDGRRCMQGRIARCMDGK